jgi:hypothetical protein
MQVRHDAVDDDRNGNGGEGEGPRDRRQWAQPTAKNDVEDGDIRGATTVGLTVINRTGAALSSAVKRSRNVSSPAAPGSRLVGGLWLLTAGLASLPALLLWSFAEDAAARGAAIVLLLCAGIALATGVAAWTARSGLQISLASSAFVLVAAAAALAVLDSDGSVGFNGAVLFGGSAVGGALVTGVVAAWQLWRASRHE